MDYLNLATLPLQFPNLDTDSGPCFLGPAVEHEATNNEEVLRPSRRSCHLPDLPGLRRGY